LSVSGGELTVCENCALSGYYAPSIGNFVPTFRDNLSVPSSGVKNKKEERSYVLRGRNLKLLTLFASYTGASN